MKTRTAEIERKTLETDISVNINLDGSGEHNISTGIGFLDHLFSALSKHSRCDINISCKGDIHIDDHHTAEDCALSLGMAFDKALGNRSGIARFGHAYAPLDEALSRSVVDLSGRPFSYVNLLLDRDMIGGIAAENISHVFSSFALAARISLHVDVLRGENDHHKAEAAFKSLALALRNAISSNNYNDIPSTKGVL